MGTKKFDIVFAGNTVAENLELDIALVLVEALINKYYAQVEYGAPVLIRISKEYIKYYESEYDDGVKREEN